MLALLFTLATAPVSLPPRVCDNKPVLMVVSGPTRDAARMRAYGQKIAESGIYDRLGAYYLNAPRPIATFEGTPPPNLTTLIVRFPCLANAEAFWHSKLYQEMILPMRRNPSAGDYVVTVYPEIPVRAQVADGVASNAYRRTFDASGEERAKR
jgi:uncharacterized protein (DUF1330 family)